MADATRPYRLSLSGSATMAELRAVATAIVDSLCGTGATWVRSAHQPLPDRNPVESTNHRTTWTRPGAQLIEMVRSGGGNPYCGYAYDASWQLRIDEPPTVVTLQAAGGWEQHQPLEFAVEIPSAADFERLRAAVVGVVGRRRDRSGRRDAAIQNVLAARISDPDRARRWLDEAMAPGARAAGGSWPELLTLHDELVGTDADSLRLRLRTVPQDITAWERAAAEGVKGFSSARIAQVLARLRPYDPAVIDPEASAAGWSRAPTPTLGWLRFDDGHGPSRGGWPAIVPTILRTLMPRVVASPPQFIERGSDKVEARVTTSSVQAAWVGRGGLPQVVVERRSRWLAPPRPPTRSKRRARRVRVHTWAFGPRPDDCLQIVVRSRRQNNETVHQGIALAASGTRAFLADVRAAMATATPHRWVAAAPGELFPERDLRR